MQPVSEPDHLAEPRPLILTFSPMAMGEKGRLRHKKFEPGGASGTWEVPFAPALP